MANYEGRYRAAIEQTGLDYQTLRNYAWVARRFSVSRRRDNLSFGHHAEVMSLTAPEQDFWLRKADELGWSVKQLRREVRASLRERSDEADGRSGLTADEGRSELPSVRLEIDVSAQQMEKCRAAADKVGLSLVEWVALVLEQAIRMVHDQQPRPVVNGRP
jgi:hypothetical protein